MNACVQKGRKTDMSRRFTKIVAIVLAAIMVVTTFSMAVMYML